MGITKVSRERCVRSAGARGRFGANISMKIIVFFFFLKNAHELWINLRALFCKNKKLTHTVTIFFRAWCNQNSRIALSNNQGFNEITNKMFYIHTALLFFNISQEQILT